DRVADVAGQVEDDARDAPPVLTAADLRDRVGADGERGLAPRVHRVLRSMISRRGASISSARYFVSLEVQTKMLMASGCEVTVTSLRTAGPAWAATETAGTRRTTARLTATSTMGICRSAVI